MRAAKRSGQKGALLPPAVAVTHELVGGGRLQAVDEVRRALCMAGGGEDRTGVGFEDVQHARFTLTHCVTL